MAELKGKESSKEASVDLVKHTSDGFSSSLKMQRIKEKENNNTRLLKNWHYYLISSMMVDLQCSWER